MHQPFGAIARAEFPALPKEAPCFPISRFILEVPKDLPADLQARGASALPIDPFAFAQLWLDHYWRASASGSKASKPVR